MTSMTGVAGREWTLAQRRLSSGVRVPTHLSFAVGDKWAILLTAAGPNFACINKTSAPPP